MSDSFEFFRSDNTLEGELGNDLIVVNEGGDTLAWIFGNETILDPIAGTSEIPDSSWLAGHDGFSAGWTTDADCGEGDDLLIGFNGTDVLDHGDDTPVIVRISGSNGGDGIL
jgi:Ca2+-binding RTX toxin-like protein